MSYHCKVPSLLSLSNSQSGLPVNTIAPTATGTNYVGYTLTGTQGTWTSNPSSDNWSYAQVWQYSNDGVNYTDESGATSLTLSSNVVYETYYMRLKVTATNENGSTIAYSNALRNWIPSDDVSAISWHDPADASTIYSSSDLVSQFDDKIGSNNFTQSNEALALTYSVRSVNSQFVMEGRGFEYMSTAYTVPASGNLNIVFMAKIEGVDSLNDSIVSMDSTSNDFQLQSTTSTEYIPRMLVSDIGGALSSSTAVSTSAIFRITFDFSGDGKYYIYVNGSDVSSGGGSYSSKLNTSQTFRIFSNRGTNQQIDGVLGDVITTEAVDNATSQKIEGVLAHKWGLTSQLVAGHPYITNAPAL